MVFRPIRPLAPYLIIVLAAAAVIGLFSQFMILKVAEESMIPTLADGQWILVLRGSGRVHAGDVAVFVSPLDRGLAVKRCILEEGASPVVDHGWLVTPWGRWFLTGTQWNRLEQTGTVPDGSVFMVGDNQFRSMDSRSYGYIPRDRLLGRVLLPPAGRNRD